MGQKIYRSPAKKKPRKKCRYQRNSFSGKGDGRGFLVAFATVMTGGGIMAILKPITIFSSGATASGRYRMAGQTFAYSENACIGFGILFVVVGLFLFRVYFELKKR
ncbi:hypothetical protein [Luteolibacter sp. AS25]|uniref:hypothetical protein n=1 Tax=Luteolibacter sp. AS25 TaxID=3135776 RepID=UPI00398A67E5